MNTRVVGVSRGSGLVVDGDRPSLSTVEISGDWDCVCSGQSGPSPVASGAVVVGGGRGQSPVVVVAAAFLFASVAHGYTYYSVDQLASANGNWTTNGSISYANGGVTSASAGSLISNIAPPSGNDYEIYANIWLNASGGNYGFLLRASSDALPPNAGSYLLRGGVTESNGFGIILQGDAGVHEIGGRFGLDAGFDERVVQSAGAMAGGGSGLAGVGLSAGEHGFADAMLRTSLRQQLSDLIQVVGRQKPVGLPQQNLVAQATG